MRMKLQADNSSSRQALSLISRAQILLWWKTVKSLKILTTFSTLQATNSPIPSWRRTHTWINLLNSTMTEEVHSDLFTSACSLPLNPISSSLEQSKQLSNCRVALKDSPSLLIDSSTGSSLSPPKRIWWNPSKKTTKRQHKTIQMEDTTWKLPLTQKDSLISSTQNNYKRFHKCLSMKNSKSSTRQSSIPSIIK